MRQFQVVEGQPSDEELAAIACALEALQRQRQTQLDLGQQDAAPRLSPWQLSGRLNAFERPTWNSTASPWQRSSLHSW